MYNLSVNIEEQNTTHFGYTLQQKEDEIMVSPENCYQTLDVQSWK